MRIHVHTFPCSGSPWTHMKLQEGAAEPRSLHSALAQKGWDILRLQVATSKDFHSAPLRIYIYIVCMIMYVYYKRLLLNSQDTCEALWTFFRQIGGTGFLYPGRVPRNIDSLHQRAGSKQVIEIHGTMATVRHVEVGLRYQGLHHAVA
jgi:Holliday junction resolvase